MAYKQKPELNEEQILSFLTGIVQKIRTEEDPLELNEYRRLFRKAVPLTLRSYFAAYLLKQQFSGTSQGRQSSFSRNERPAKTGKKDRNERAQPKQDEQKRTRQSENRRPENRAAQIKVNETQTGERQPSEVRIVLSDDVSTTLFLSIGRNRRVYPRDLIGLIMQNVEIEREHIGEIRVLDNYSFVQVITADAEKIIATLNEFEYRGRKLAVSYSRKREEQPLTDSSAEEGTEAEIGTDIDAEIDDETLSASSSGDSWLSDTDDIDSYGSETDVSDNKENNGNI